MTSRSVLRSRVLLTRHIISSPNSMPFPKPLTKVKLWIGVLFLLLLTMFYFYLRFNKSEEEEEGTISVPVFRWIAVHNLTSLDRCRNSKQGHTLIADELGYVCSLSSVLPSGCCNQLKSSTSRYECSGCHDSGCCAVYEHCVSCCLHPDKQPLLRSILSRSTETFNPLYSSLRDQFELCLTKCRTSSQSVQHENTYRNPRTKFCYGTGAPTLVPEMNNIVREEER